MLMLIFLSSVLVSFAVSLWFVGGAARLGLIDTPNIRSSHTMPTPRGGGIGIVIGMAAALCACFLAGAAETVVKYPAIAGGFFAMALLGFCSDRFNISILARIVFHVLIAVVMVWATGWPESLTIGGLVITFGGMGAVFCVIWLVAITNFYNFMDGIDGLAAMQGMIAGVAIAVFGVILGSGPLVPMGLVLSGASAGFLVLNFPPARIFMGDTGSYSMGLYIASFGIIDKRLAVPIAMVLGVFIFDASVTLVNRIIKGEEWYMAHRSHFYQRAVRLGYSHLRVMSILSAVTALETCLACLYLKAPPPAQIVVLIASLSVLMAMALWVVIKERRLTRA